MQQGRVQVDADWNEQNDIQFHYDQSHLRDIVGKCGTPVENGGFEILPNFEVDLTSIETDANVADSLRQFLRNNFGLYWIENQQFNKNDKTLGLKEGNHQATISLDGANGKAVLAIDGNAGEYEFLLDPKGKKLYSQGYIIGAGKQDTVGHYYVDGILCENDYSVDVTMQHDLQMDRSKVFISEKGEHIVPNPAMPVNEGERYLAYLDVWERHVTHHEDPYIREKALGDVDTATRTKIAWQVKLINVEGHFGNTQQPTIMFDKDAYNLGEPVRVTVAEPLLARDQTLRRIIVRITATKGPEGDVALDLMETGVNTGYFTGDFTFMHMQGNVGIQVASNKPKKIPGLEEGGKFRAIYQYGRDKKIVWDEATLDAQQKGSVAATLDAQREVSDLSDMLDHAFAQIDNPTTGKMKARASPSPDIKSHCSPYETAGYQKLENQLYRVEVHESGNLASATFKWSRDNGTIVSRVTEFQSADNQIRIEKRGRDKFLDFDKDQWVEMTDELHESLGLPGTLVKLVSVDDTMLKYDPRTVYGKPIQATNYASNPRVRRWESRTGQRTAPTMPLAVQEGVIITVETPRNSGYIHLEEGIEIQLSADGHYKSGDYWFVPARTNDGDVEWPQVAEGASGEPLAILPNGIAHHYAPLAVIRRSGEGRIQVLDLRILFPSLTDIVDVSLGSSATTGIAVLKMPPRFTSPLIFGPFDHQLQALDVPPSVSLGISIPRKIGGDIGKGGRETTPTTTVAEAILVSEDFVGFPWILKPILVTLTQFYIFVARAAARDTSGSYAALDSFIESISQGAKMSGMSSTNTSRSNADASSNTRSAEATITSASSTSSMARPLGRGSGSMARLANAGLRGVEAALREFRAPGISNMPTPDIHAPRPDGADAANQPESSSPPPAGGVAPNPPVVLEPDRPPEIPDELKIRWWAVPAVDTGVQVSEPIRFDEKQVSIGFDKESYTLNDKVKVTAISPAVSGGRRAKTIDVRITGSSRSNGAKLELIASGKNTDEFEGGFTLVKWPEGVGVGMRVGKQTLLIRGLKPEGQFYAVYEYEQGKQVSGTAKFV